MVNSCIWKWDKVKNRRRDCTSLTCLMVKRATQQEKKKNDEGMNLPVNSCISKRSKIKLSFIVFLLEPHALKLAHMFHGKGKTTTEKKKNDKGVT